MVLDSKIMLLREKFNIRTVNDWTRVSPAEVLATPDIGEATLNHLRLHLAGHGVTLRDDSTPEFWQSHLFETKLGTVQVSDEDRSVVCPFTVIVDAQEKHPFQFKGMTTDGEKKPIIVRTITRSLGATHGDYSILGMEGECHIERKSPADAIGTILGWNERRDRFKATLEFLTGVRGGAVVVECSFGELIRMVDARGKKTVEENRKILHRSILSWMVHYTVPWFFCDTRRLAEITTFRLMQRCYKKQIDSQKKAEAH